MQTSGNHWYHCIVSTYGSWIRGDVRGWRSRKHHEHVQGDYKHPPPEEAYQVIRRHTLRIMKRKPVVLTHDQRLLICHWMAQYLTHAQVTWADYCIGATHFHLLARIPPEVSLSCAGLTAANQLSDGRPPWPRHLLGRLKAHTSFLMRQEGHHTAPGGLWGVRSKIIPIKDRNHQIQVVRYIRNHRDEGAVVWSDLKSDPPSNP
jgi:hypothetical protein